jgi:RNA polymerase sigma factor (sigma-70 family)
MGNDEGVFRPPAGRPPKWEDEFRESYPRLVAAAYRVAVRFFGGGSTARTRAEDAAHEAVTRAYVHWEKATRHDRPEAWVVNTTINVCREMARSEEKFHRPSAIRSRQWVTDAQDEVSSIHALNDVLSKLTRREREVTVWRYVLDCSESETAHQLGISASQVRETAHRARLKLRRLLGDDTEAFT